MPSFCLVKKEFVHELSTAVDSVIVLVLLLLFIESSNGQQGIRVPLTMRDVQGHQHTIIFGVDPQATYGFDAELGEQPIPPVPTVPAFDVRFLDAQGRKQYAYDGAYVDVRAYTSRAQADTFYVGFQPAEGLFPVEFSWPLDEVLQFDEAILQYDDHGSSTRIDMKRVGSVEIASGSSLVVITRGPVASWREQ